MTQVTNDIHFSLLAWLRIFYLQVIHVIWGGRVQQVYVLQNQGSDQGKRVPGGSCRAGRLDQVLYIILPYIKNINKNFKEVE